uniref:ARAD1C38566p n=1 Tax=Blastobotrys adeninivorans TaxID=409370 RepID=A0A060T434_BLAAD
MLHSRVIVWLLGTFLMGALLVKLWSAEKSAIREINHHPSLHGSKLDGRENATFITLAQNSDLEKLMTPIQAVEDRFNHKYHYDWVFLNNKPFSDEFKQTVSRIVSGEAKFGTIEKEHWSYPDWIDQQKAAQDRKKLEEENVIYGGSESYRHMCRFESGFFFQHELMKDYKYYWRVEPETELLCDIDYDVFEFMRKNKKKYGWTLSITEWEKTIPTLWKTTKEFLDKHPDYVHPNAMKKFVSEQDDLDKYTLCHFWSNFEVADMDFWRDTVYQEYFNHLDKSGGFFYERWGDAPVHSIAAALFMDQDEVHFFDDIGYRHPPFQHCPNFQEERGLKCHCAPSWSFDWHDSSCLRTYIDAKGLEHPKDYH